MKHLYGILIFLSLVICSQGQDRASRAPQVFLLDRATLIAEKQHYIADHNNTLAAAVRAAADRAMKEGPFSVMDKPAAPPSGDKHDYVSMGTYWWPNPKTPNGLPYIRRDGERNPEIEKIPDHQNMGRVGRDSRILALAFYLTGEEVYAARSALLQPRKIVGKPLLHSLLVGRRPVLRAREQARGVHDIG